MILLTVYVRWNEKKLWSLIFTSYQDEQKQKQPQAKQVLFRRKNGLDTRIC